MSDSNTHVGSDPVRAVLIAVDAKGYPPPPPLYEAAEIRDLLEETKRQADQGVDPDAREWDDNSPPATTDLHTRPEILGDVDIIIVLDLAYADHLVAESALENLYSNMKLHFPIRNQSGTRRKLGGWSGCFTFGFDRDSRAHVNKLEVEGDYFCDLAYERMVPGSVRRLPSVMESRWGWSDAAIARILGQRGDGELVGEFAQEASPTAPEEAPDTYGSTSAGTPSPSIASPTPADEPPPSTWTAAPHTFYGTARESSRATSSTRRPTSRATSSRHRPTSAATSSPLPQNQARPWPTPQSTLNCLLVIVDSGATPPDLLQKKVSPGTLNHLFLSHAYHLELELDSQSQRTFERISGFGARTSKRELAEVREQLTDALLYSGVHIDTE